jgi:metallo-beta-lactamase family protein
VVGYQAEGTLGRRIVDGEREIKIFEQTFRVSASVHTIGGFSSHAGRDDLLGWLKKTGRPSHAFLVHGEEAALRAFAEKIESDGLAGKAHVPAMNEGFTL